MIQNSPLLYTHIQVVDGLYTNKEFNILPQDAINLKDER